MQNKVDSCIHNFSHCTHPSTSIKSEESKQEISYTPRCCEQYSYQFLLFLKLLYTLSKWDCCLLIHQWLIQGDEGEQTPAIEQMIV